MSENESVTNVTNVTTIFALATHKGKFETEEDFADTIVPCYDWIA